MALYPSFQPAQRAAVPNMAWASAIQGDLERQAKLARQQQIQDALSGAGDIYGGISNVMNPGVKQGEEGYRDPLTTGIKAIKNKFQGMGGGKPPAGNVPTPAAGTAGGPPMPTVPGGGGLGVPGGGPRGAPPPMRMPAGLEKQAATAQALRGPAQGVDAATKGADAATKVADAGSKLGKVAGSAGTGLGYLGTALQGADAVQKFRAGDNYQGGKSAANAVGSGLLTVGLANAYNPLGWAALAGGAAASLYGMLG